MLRWFGSYKRPSWEIGKAREAYANVRGGRYRIRRIAEDAFTVSYSTPHSMDGFVRELGKAATQAEAEAQAHNDGGPDA